MVRNEASYLTEWLHFHFLVGATRIVIYDDGSEDGLEQVVAPFGSRIVLHRLATLPGLDPEFLQKSRRAFLFRKVWAFNHCGREHSQGAGWLAVLDVDEFIFPCNAASAADVGQGFAQRMAIAGAAAVGLRLQCVKFGFNDLNRKLAPGELVTQAHSQRAPYSDIEPEVEAAVRANLTGCKPAWCISVGSHKAMYRLEQAAWARPGIHGPGEGSIMPNMSTAWDRHQGVCCNHYMMRSEEELLEKYSKTHLQSTFAPLAYDDPRRWYRSVQDTLVWQFLPQLQRSMQAAATAAVVPPVLPGARMMQ